MLIGLAGLAGSGKGEAAKLLVNNHGFAALALADPMKEFAQDVFGWDRERLWGPSERRSEPDPRSTVMTCHQCGWYGQRYDCISAVKMPGNINKTLQICPHCSSHDLQSHPLSARIFLQLLGTEFGRAVYPNIWIDAALDRAKAIEDGVQPTFLKSIEWPAILPEGGFAGVIITDVRFRNELDAIQGAGGYIVRVVRNETTSAKGIDGHASESEQSSIPPRLYDVTIQNTGTLDALASNVAAAVETLKGESR